MQSNNGGLACVVVNLGDVPESVEINFEDKSGEVIIATPFHPTVRPLYLSPIYPSPSTRGGGEAMMAPSNPGLGLVMIMLSGVLTASFPFPMKFSRAWRWENTWLVYATFALVIIPVSLALWSMPTCSRSMLLFLRRSFCFLLLFGFGWGIAQVTFGLSIARVGMAMAFAIVVGLSSLLGSVIPLAIFHRGPLQDGQVSAFWQALRSSPGDWFSTSRPLVNVI